MVAAGNDKEEYKKYVDKSPNSKLMLNVSGRFSRRAYLHGRAVFRYVQANGFDPDVVSSLTAMTMVSECCLAL